MLTEFVGLQLTREELLEIQKALLAQAFLLDTVRREKGEIEPDEHELLQKIEALLGETDESLHALDHCVEDEMWEYAWYAFTDEWAWHRSLQTVKLNKGSQFDSLTEIEKEELIEREYKEHFDQYVTEIDMRESLGKKKFIGLVVADQQKPDSKSGKKD
ncbi:hypothetical protein IT408_01380 [Candidatus Uhrbacteria bacterium]|nr:hypothetical protein [Candidatus Uhrbacteria bacterium]